ncbi:MAG: hypothetical protein HS107_01155 [Thermoflexaceae bacterium]|nr:hypothetical protein [Thermoflexaceae bacterium]
MAKFSKMPREKAPNPVRQTGRLKARMREYEDHVASIKKGEAGRLDPEGGETVRGIALRISRAAKRMGVSVRTWVVEGSVYFELSR